MMAVLFHGPPSHQIYAYRCTSLYCLAEVRIDYGEDYWFRTEKLHRKVAEYDQEGYSRAINVTLNNQKRGNRLLIKQASKQERKITRKEPKKYMER
jgi:hypothetical protein